MPEGLKEIPPFLFARCINLKRIAPKAFAYCENLFIPFIPADCDVAENAFLSEWDYDPEEEVL